MPFCSHCGKEINEGATFCNDCGASLKSGEKSPRRSNKKKKFILFFIGLILVLVIGAMIDDIESASIPYDVQVEMAFVEACRELSPTVQSAIARQQGKTVEELLTSPYDPWAPKVFIGLVSAYCGAWGIYLAYSFFRFVDK